MTAAIPVKIAGKESPGPHGKPWLAESLHTFTLLIDYIAPNNFMDHGEKIGAYRLSECMNIFLLSPKRVPALFSQT